MYLWLVIVVDAGMIEREDNSQPGKEAVLQEPMVRVATGWKRKPFGIIATIANVYKWIQGLFLPSKGA